MFSNKDFAFYENATFINGTRNCSYTVVSSGAADSLDTFFNDLFTPFGDYDRVKSHERGSQLTGPFLEMTQSPNLVFNKPIV